MNPPRVRRHNIMAMQRSIFAGRLTLFAAAASAAAPVPHVARVHSSAAARVASRARTLHMRAEGSDAKLGLLRAAMAEVGVDAFVVPSGDPHLSEYVHPHCRQPSSNLCSHLNG